MGGSGLALAAVAEEGEQEGMMGLDEQQREDLVAEVDQALAMLLSLGK